MAEPAIKAMTLGGFLHWQDGTDTRYELISGTKVPAYREIESVQEILLIDSESADAEIFRRRGSVWFSEIVQGRDLDFPRSAIRLQLPMREIYDGIDLEADVAS